MRVCWMLGVVMMTSLMADMSYFERDVNVEQLKQCQEFVTLGKDVKTIHLLNGETLALNDEYYNNDPEYKTLFYTIKGCFFKEKYLIYSDFMPDSEAYYALNLQDGKDMRLDGMPFLSPAQNYFATEADESHRVSIYTFEHERIVKVFSHKYPEQCVTQHTLWLDNQTLRFKLECDGAFDEDTNTTKENTKEMFKLIQKDSKWEILQSP